MNLEKEIIIEPYKTHMLKVDDVHTLYVEECGNPDGVPVVFLHGGPGGNIKPENRLFFDMEYYRVILFDQRGCGKSTPFAELKDNTVEYLVSDMEKIREYLNIEKWHVFGGSFGSTLALCYSISHPERVKTIIARGIFLGRNEDIHWLFQEGTSFTHPDKFEKFLNHIDESERKDLVSAYYKKLTSKDEKIRKAAAKIWSDWEMSVVTIVPLEVDENAECTDDDVSLALLECHYFVNKMFWENDNYILDNVDKIKDIKLFIVHGRYDVDCRASGAYELYKKCPNSELKIVEASGHSAKDGFLHDSLVEVLNKIRDYKL